MNIPRTHRPGIRPLISLALLGLASGCVSQSQLTKVMKEKEQLTALVAQEKKQNAELAQQVRKLNERAAEAERELALRYDGKSPPGMTASVRRSLPNDPLDVIARAEPRVKYDPLRRVARLPLDVSFTTENRLPFQSRRELDRVADLLLQPEAARCGVRVRVEESQAGDAQAVAKGNAVVDYLKQRGIAADRLAVGSNPAITPLVDEDGRKRNIAATGVEVEFFELAPTSAPSSPLLKSADNSSASDGWVPARRNRE